MPAERRGCVLRLRSTGHVVRITAMSMMPGFVVLPARMIRAVHGLCLIRGFGDSSSVVSCRSSALVHRGLFRLMRDEACRSGACFVFSQRDSAYTL